jgi:hypothetical protein
LGKVAGGAANFSTAGVRDATAAVAVGGVTGGAGVSTAGDTVEVDGDVAVGDYADADDAAAWIDDLFGDAGGAAGNSPVAYIYA